MFSFFQISQTILKQDNICGDWSNFGGKPPSVIFYLNGNLS